MLHEFLSENRHELIERCRSKAGRRVPESATPRELAHGIPLFLEQLVDALRREQDIPEAQRGKAEPHGATPTAALKEGTRASSLHGQDLFEQGYTVGQVVHGYGDICQSLTELAKETKASISVDEYHTFNRLLDNAIADAVTSFGHHRDSGGAEGLHQRIGLLADELRQHINTALSALDAIKVGQIGVMGTTGAVLEDSLISLRDLVDKSLPEIRLQTGMTQPPPE
jgi:hypothetical protein